MIDLDDYERRLKAAEAERDAALNAAAAQLGLADTFWDAVVYINSNFFWSTVAWIAEATSMRNWKDSLLRERSTRGYTDGYNAAVHYNPAVIATERMSHFWSVVGWIGYAQYLRFLAADRAIEREHVQMDCIDAIARAEKAEAALKVVAEKSEVAMVRDLLNTDDQRFAAERQRDEATERADLATANAAATQAVVDAARKVRKNMHVACMNVADERLVAALAALDNATGACIEPLHDHHDGCPAMERCPVKASGEDAK